MTTLQKLNLIFSYQDKLRQLAIKAESGVRVDADLVNDLSAKIIAIRKIL